MGNVHAFSTSSPAPPPPTMNFAKGEECPKPEQKATETIENPGPLEEIHTKCKSKYYLTSFMAITSIIVKCFRRFPYMF